MSQTLVPCSLPEHFHAATRKWFSQQFTAPTQAQVQGWATILEGRHTLISAPTGSGKTLAAFLSAIDELVQEAASGTLDNETRVVHVSPLKALGNDVERNLAEPLARIGAIAKQQGYDLTITTAVRTGDTPQSERAKMVRRPPHILVTTPEGLYALVTSKGGRSMLAHVRTVIIDEIHALAPDRRGAHLSITLERLQALVEDPIQRIGLSATQNPIDEVARFLIGSKSDDCAIIDEGHGRKRDLMIETPDSRLKAVMSNEELEEIYDRVAKLAEDHRTTLIFVNSRRQCERVAHNLAQRLGEEQVAAHHGSLSPPLRLHAERRLKAGELSVLVATASLELGIDIGDVDLVIQLGALKRIAMFLQRVGGACHWHGGIPKGRLFPQNDRCHLFSYSLTDPHWLEAVSWSVHEPVMIICEGVLNFIAPEAVQAFFQMIAIHFTTKTQFIFDYVHPWLVRAANQSKYVRNNSAEFKWGIRNIQEVIAWNKRFQLIDEFPIMSEVGSIKGLIAALFYQTAGSHLYAIAQLELSPVSAI